MSSYPAPAPLPAEPCDICGDPVVEGERFTITDDSVEHASCTAAWFRKNWGREYL